MSSKLKLASVEIERTAGWPGGAVSSFTTLRAAQSGDPPVVVRVADAPGSVAVLTLDAAGALGVLDVQVLAHIPPRAVPRAVDSALLAIRPRCVVVGIALSRLWSAPNGMAMVAARPGLGVWSAFAALVPAWMSRPGRVALVDYDAGRQSLGVATVDIKTASGLADAA